MQIEGITILSIIAGYFFLLIAISYFTGGKSTQSDFFLAGRKSKWYVVAFGMIGATLSGVTFISVPGWVLGSQFSYMQMVLGYIFGTIIIVEVLLPIYYELNLTTIYSYLEKRFGFWGHKTGSAFFLLSRTMGASLRLFLVAIVLDRFVTEPIGIPFWVTVLFTIFLIWIYTFRGGIKTIVWTDTLQTFAMLSAVIVSIIVIMRQMDLDFGGMIKTIKDSTYSKTFFFDGGWEDPKHFIKKFLGGASIAIAMTGLDQDMMQKNLSCKSYKDSRKNMYTMISTLVFVNLLFLSLGALLFIYANNQGIELPKRTDLVYPTLAISHLGPIVSVTFIIGLIAAAYSSADSALTSLTTTFLVDFMGFEKKDKVISNKKQKRFGVHFAFSMILFIIILFVKQLNNSEIIYTLFKIAGYTYGPLLGLFFFGIFTKRKVNDSAIPIIAILAPIITYLLNINSEILFWGYKFDFELLILNGLLTFLGLYLLSKPELDAETAKG